MKKTEKNYLISLFAVFVVLALAGVFSFIYAVVDISKNGTIMNNILELVYMGIHLIVLAMGLAFTYTALKTKKGSHIMKSLMITPNTTNTSRPAVIIAATLSTIGLAIGVYFILVLCRVPLPYFHFPIALLLDLVNSPLTLFMVGLYFVFYPYIFHRCLKEEK